MTKRIESTIATRAPKAAQYLYEAGQFAMVLAGIEDQRAFLKDADASERKGLTLALQKACDAALAKGIKFKTKTVSTDGKAEQKMDDSCPTRAEFWSLFLAGSKDEHGHVVGWSSGYARKMKTAVNWVMSGLAEDLKDYADIQNKRGKHAPRQTVAVTEPAPAKPATTVAAPSEPNAMVDSVATTWHYIGTAPTHLAMLRKVVALLEETEGLTLEGAVAAAVKEYDAQQRAMMKSRK